MYIIGNDLLYLKKTNKQTVIVTTKEVIKTNLSINSIINFNCLIYGSNQKGRIEYAKNILNSKYKIPIFINNKIILLPLKSTRKEEYTLVVLNKIIDYYSYDNYLNIVFNNRVILKEKISQRSFDKLFINGNKLLNDFNTQKY